MKRIAVFVLGLIGGIFGIISGLMAIMMGGVGKAVGSGSQGLGSLGFFAILFSVLAIVSACMINHKPKLFGWLLIVSAVGGTISVSFFYILSGLLILIAGIIALVKKDTFVDRDINEVEVR
ncbi:MAG TPA: DUF4064 domain-containing protein [Clostridium sp.]